MTDRTVEFKDGHYWLIRDGSCVAVAATVGRSLSLQVEGSRPTQEDSFTIVRQADLAALLQAMGWEVKLPESDSY